MKPFRYRTDENFVANAMCQPGVINHVEHPVTLTVSRANPEPAAAFAKTTLMKQFRLKQVVRRNFLERYVLVERNLSHDYATTLSVTLFSMLLKATTT